MAQKAVVDDDVNLATTLSGAWSQQLMAKMKTADQSLERYFKGSLRIWLAGSLLVAMVSLAICAHWGIPQLLKAVHGGPFSVPAQTFAAVAVTWLSWGCALFFLGQSQIRSRHGVTIICSLLILLLYVNILRERAFSGDYIDYINAARDIHDGRHLHPRFIYPPFLASIFELFLPLGSAGLPIAYWLANVLALLAFFWLLKAVLELYGFGSRLSPLVVFVFMAVNVPVLRTLVYGQVNLQVINLILLAVLLFSRHQILSALALAAAVQLKASPLILVLPFLWARDVKWTVSFVAGLAAITCFTWAPHGWAPFADFAANARNIYSANGISFHDNSVDSLVRAGASVWGLPMPPQWVVFLLKVPVLAGIFLATVLNFRRGTFVSRNDPRRDILNTLPSLLVLMVLASPLVWEHHPVFLALSFLLILTKLNTPLMWVGYSFAYLLEFLMPTFDFYPWSYGRLLSPLLLAAFMLKATAPGYGALFSWCKTQIDAFPWKTVQTDGQSRAESAASVEGSGWKG